MAACNVLFLILVGLTSFCAVYSSVKLSHVSTIYLPYAIDDAGVEQIEYLKASVEQLSYDPADKLIYVAGHAVIHVVNATDPTNLVREHSLFLPDADVTDIEVCGDYVFVSVDNEKDRSQGQLRVFKKYTQNGNDSLAQLHNIVVGAVPDMIEPRPDCRTVVIALEGEAYTDANGTFLDPEGAVVIVHFPYGVDGPVPASVKKLDFRQFNDQYDALKPSGVRFVYRGNNNSFSNDVEPEYVALDNKGNKAYVVLQENNGVAEVDLNTETITKIHGLGYKQWGSLDASNVDNGIRMTFWPIRAFYLPDTAKFHEWQGRKLLFTANEGDAKEYAMFAEESRGHDFINKTENLLHQMETAAIPVDADLGRLKFSNVDGLDDNGKYSALYAYGGRSFSIWDAANDFHQVYDSGSDIEQTTALQCPHLFNTNGQVIDERSDDKGPETESLELAEIDGRLYIFIGNERPGTIFVYSIGSDVTQPRFEQIFCDGIPNDSRSLTEKFAARELYAVDPEDLRFYDISDSPVDYPILIVAGAVSGTVSILKVEVTPESPPVAPVTPAPCKNPTTDDPYNHSNRVSSYIPVTFLGIVLQFYLQSRSRR